MISNIKDQNFTLLSKMMQMTSQRQKVIAENIANINTPNYRRGEFNFESALREAFRSGSPDAFEAVQGEIDQPNNTAVRNNGNNVDIDMEMAALHDTASAYDIYAQLYNRAHSLTMAAIKN